MNDKKQKDKVFSKIIAGLILYTFFLIAIFIANFSVFHVSDDVGKWGSVGDYFGGLLNPILAFLSFIGVLWTLKMSREELFETRKVLDGQLKTQNLQQFDSFFFNFLEHISNKLELLIDSGRIKEVHADIFNPKTRKSHSGRQFLLLDHQEVMILFNMVFELLSNIDQSSIDMRKKNKYINVVKSLLPQDVLELLIVLGQKISYGRDYCEFRVIIEKYALLENIKFYGGNIFKTSLLLTMSQKYKEGAFGENINFKRFQKSILYQEFEKGMSFFVILFGKLLECQYVNNIDWQQQKYILINEGNQELKKFMFAVDEFENLVDETTVIYITSGYLHSMEITDFRLEKNIIHLKTQGKWQTAIGFKEKGLVRLPSLIVDDRYFDNCIRIDD